MLKPAHQLFLIACICSVTGGALADSSARSADAGVITAPVKVATQIQVEGAYVNVPIPGTQNTAAFFTLRNQGNQPASLVSVQVDVAQRTELHSHTTKDGMMQMRREEQILIPAKSTVEFASGSYHVMLFDLRRSIQTGEELQLLLTFADGRQTVTTAKVKSIFDKVHHH